MEQLKLVQYQRPIGAGLPTGQHTTGVLLGMAGSCQHIMQTDTLDIDVLPHDAEEVKPCQSRFSDAMNSTLQDIAAQMVQPKRWKAIRMLTASGSGTRTWLGQGLGPVGLQVQAAMLADIQRVYDESLPQRLEPINFKDINLWHKVCHHLTLTGVIQSPSSLLDSLAPHLPAEVLIEMRGGAMLQPTSPQRYQFNTRPADSLLPDQQVTQKNSLAQLPPLPSPRAVDVGRDGSPAVDSSFSGHQQQLRVEDGTAASGAEVPAGVPEPMPVSVALEGPAQLPIACPDYQQQHQQPRQPACPSGPPQHHLPATTALKTALASPSQSSPAKRQRKGGLGQPGVMAAMLAASPQPQPQQQQPGSGNEMLPLAAAGCGVGTAVMPAQSSAADPATWNRQPPLSPSQQQATGEHLFPSPPSAAGLQQPAQGYMGLAQQPGFMLVPTAAQPPRVAQSSNLAVVPGMPAAAAGGRIAVLHPPTSPQPAAALGLPAVVKAIAGMIGGKLDSSTAESIIGHGDQVTVICFDDHGVQLGSVQLEVQQLLGIGSNGVVYLASVQQLEGYSLEESLQASMQEKLQVGMQVVLKVPAVLMRMIANNEQISDAWSQGAYELMLEEFVVMIDSNSCQHSVHTYGLGRMQHSSKPSVKLPVLLLEYCNLGSWGDLLFPGGRRNSNLIKKDAATVHFIMQQLVQVLIHVAGNSILHRDVKPANIMLKGSSLGCCAVGAPAADAYANREEAYPFTVKLGDFGWARYKPGACTDDKGVGTPAFHAPEMGSKDVTNYGVMVDAWAAAMSFLVGRSGIPVPFRYQTQTFVQLSYEQALQTAEAGIRELPAMYGTEFSKRELDFVDGGLKLNPVFRWTANRMSASKYITQGPDDSDTD